MIGCVRLRAVRPLVEYVLPQGYAPNKPVLCSGSGICDFISQSGLSLMFCILCISRVLKGGGQSAACTDSEFMESSSHVFLLESGVRNR